MNLYSQTMEDEDCTLVRYLIAEDNPNYEFLDNDDDIHTLVSAMDAETSYHGSIHVRRFVPRECVDGEARIIRQYFAANPIYTLKSFVKGIEHGMSNYCLFSQYVHVAYIFYLAGSV